MILFLITFLSLLFGIVSCFFAVRYKYLYHNLRTNFKSFLTFVDKHYIRKNDVILHNAVVEALEGAEKNNFAFEIKAYKKLLQSLKEEN